MIHIDAGDYANVWTDGSCVRNGTPYAKAAIGVWFEDFHPFNVSRLYGGRQSNNSAEIAAVTEAANIVFRESAASNIRVYTDSRFVQSCVRDWIPSWVENDWLTPRNRPVILRRELERLTRALEHFDCADIIHVPGHSGNYGNERANQLAQNAIFLTE